MHYRQNKVAPFTGAWIEIDWWYDKNSYRLDVAPFTGAWIEIYFCHQLRPFLFVAPFTGAWIEIAANRT